MRPPAKYSAIGATAVPLYFHADFLFRAWQVQHLEPRMKFLIGLSVLQTTALIVLVAMMANEHAKEPREVGIGTSAQALSNEQASSANQPLRSFDEERLRTIVREELASQNAARARNSTDTPVIPDAATAAKFADQRQLVSQRIASLKHTGPIPDQQMQDLLGEIEQLDETGRKQSLSMLAQAINTGAIKGRL